MNSNVARIIHLLNDSPDATFSAADIISALGIGKGSAGTLMGDLAKAGRIDRAARGRYQACQLTASEGCEPTVAAVLGDTGPVAPAAPKAPKRARGAIAASLPVEDAPRGGNTGLGDHVLSCLLPGKATSVDQIVTAMGTAKVAATRKQILDSLRGLCNRGKAEKVMTNQYTKGVR
jgi:hypothetical protein